MDSAVLMAAWKSMPDPGLMPPVQSPDREKEKADAREVTVNAEPARPGK
jgi:hypothetical protein